MGAAVSFVDRKEVDVNSTEDELREKLRLAIEKDETLRDDATELLSEVRALISTLDAHHRNVNIARITGSSVSILGGMMAIIGGALTMSIVFAPVGVPLALTGMGVSAVGASTSIGSRITKFVLTSQNLAELQRKIDSFQERLSETVILHASNVTQGDSFGVLRSGLAAGGKAVNTARTIFNVTDTAGDVFQVARAGKAAAGTAVKAAAAFGRISVITSAVLMPLDIADISLASIDLHKDEGDPACQKLKKFADGLERLCHPVTPAL